MTMNARVSGEEATFVEEHRLITDAKSFHWLRVRTTALVPRHLRTFAGESHTAARRGAEARDGLHARWRSSAQLNTFGRQPLGHCGGADGQRGCDKFWQSWPSAAQRSSPAVYRPRRVSTWPNRLIALRGSSYSSGSDRTRRHGRPRPAVADRCTQPLPPPQSRLAVRRKWGLAPRVAGPLSPLKPAVPFPATVVITSPETLRTRWLSLSAT